MADRPRSELEKEKAQTRAGDALAAERRRLPMTPFPTDFTFQGPDGERVVPRPLRGPLPAAALPLLVPEDGEPCGGCTMFSDQVSPLEHINARDVTFAVVAPAPQDRIAALQAADGVALPLVHGHASPSRRRAARRSTSSLQCFLRDGENAYLTYETSSRGVEALGSVWTFLDLTPFGRQEEWEDTPPGRPQEPPYQWWRKKDEY